MHFWVNHRLLHTRPLRRFHLPHHRSVVTTPFSTYSFHPIEALMLGNVIMLPMMLHDFSFWSLASVPLFSLFFNCIGHANYDFFPKVSYAHWFAASRRHHLHHACYNGNYGFQFTFMDRLFRTRLKADAAEAQLQAHRKRVAWRTRVAGVSLPTLRNRRDWQSLAYLAALPALAAWQWVHGFWWPLYALMLFLTLGIGVIHHNHTHLRMARALGQPRHGFLDHAAAGTPHLRVLSGARGQPPSLQARSGRPGAHLSLRRRHQSSVGLPDPSGAGGLGAVSAVLHLAGPAPALARRLALLHGAVRRLAGPVGGCWR